MNLELRTIYPKHQIYYPSIHSTSIEPRTPNPPKRTLNSQMDMEDGDSIDVFAEQLGGAAAAAATTSHWGLGFRV